MVDENTIHSRQLQYQADMRQPSPKNNYFYNDKELQEGLRWYDYGARFYDPVIGMFTTVDPMAENHYNVNPYHYTLNNPLLYIDPLGLDTLKYDAFMNDPSKAVAGDVIDLGEGGYTEVLEGVTVTASKTNNKKTGRSSAAKVMAGTLAISGVLLADDATVAGIADDPAIPVVLAIGTISAGTIWLWENINRPEVTTPGVVHYTPPPRVLPGFPDAKRVPSRTRPRGVTPDGRTLEWDSQHGDVEVYDKTGRHRGSARPENGRNL